MMDEYFIKEEVYNIFDSSQNNIGTDIITYKIFKLRDTKNLIVSNTYSVTVKHRILIRGSGWQQGGSNQFENYPIMLSVQSAIIGVSNLPQGNNLAQVIALKKIFPKTINANVEQSTNNSTGSSNSQTNQTSSGSSSSNVNTFGIDLSAGWFVEGPTASVSTQYSHSWGNARSQSTSIGRANASDIQSSSGNEMSVKDWSAYASVQNFDQSSQGILGEFIQWNWGQSYPWNIFDYSSMVSDKGVLLPDDVAARLLYYGAADSGTSNEQNILLPPSDLSIFGLDFTMAAEWYITFPDNLSSIETVQFQHIVNVLHGSHSMIASGGGGQATLSARLTAGFNNIMQQPGPMDIGQYALIPLLEGQRKGMGIGFRGNLFDIQPTSPASVFKIRSKGNDLLVTGQGFSSVMSAEFSKGYAGPGATLNVGFKVVDVTTQYALNLKHWIGVGSGNITLTCSINDNQMVVNVVDPEGQGPSNNLSQLELRNYDLKSSNFHDYLALGWNEIVITILPTDPTKQSEYIISALSLEG